MTDIFDIGDFVRASTMFYSGSFAVDPTIITYEVRRPDETRSIFVYGGGDITRVTTGSYYHDVYLTQAGQWWDRWYCSGVIISSLENYFEVRRTVFP